MENQNKKTETNPVALGGAEKDGSTTQDRLRAFMATKFPEQSYDDDSALFGGVADWAEDADRELVGYKLADETIRRVAEHHPEIMDIVDDLLKDPKMPLAVAIIRNVDVDEFLPSEGDPDFEAMYKAREARVTRQSEDKVYRERRDKNLEESRAIVQNYFTENQVEEQEAIALADFADGLMESYMDGRITPRELDMFRNAMNYDKDVAEAAEIGKVEGMNAKVDAVRQRKQGATDGLPSPGSSAGAIDVPKPVKRRVIDTAKLLGISEEELEARRNSMK